MKKIILATLALVMASAVPTFAQTHHSNAREYRQDGRIVRGAVRGQLTPRELALIRAQQVRIDRAQRRAAADGVVTRAERRDIQRLQNEASRTIYRLKHSGRGFH